MKKNLVLTLCLILLCLSLAGCASESPIEVSLTGQGITETIGNMDDIKSKLMAVTVDDRPLFESVTVTENKGIFYSSYRFIATTNPQAKDTQLTLTVDLPGTPSGVRNGAISEQKVTFPLTELTAPLELAADFEQNNLSVIIGLCVALTLIVAAFFLFMKKYGGGYEH